MVQKPHQRRDWGEPSALLFALALSIALPQRYTLGGPKVMTLLAVILGLCCAASIGITLFGSRRAARTIMTVSSAILAISLILSMCRVLNLVVYHAKDIVGERLLESALMIWVSNVITFAVIYRWIGEDEFQFPRAEGVEAPRRVFLDYLFLSFTTATAFSPTDTAPLSTRARMYMMCEASVSLLTLAIAAARAVNILS